MPEKWLPNLRVRLKYDWPWKLLALLVATIVYFLLRERAQTVDPRQGFMERRLSGQLADIPVQLLQAPDNNGIWKIEPAKVNIYFNTDETIGMVPDRTTILAYIDITKQNQDGYASVKIAVDPGCYISIAKIEPAEVRLSKDFTADQEIGQDGAR
jgi:hypothetical protein